MSIPHRRTRAQQERNGAWHCIVFLSAVIPAQDWPTYRHDSARSGHSSVRLALPLVPAWTFTARHAPRPAWPGPAKRDAYNKVEGLESRLTFDRAFQVVSTRDRIYFGSSADDQVRCLDARTGEELWTFFTEAPVRFAPTVAAGAVLVGSDDGYAYCLDAATGKQRWRFRAAERDVRIPGNGRLMSPWPVRTGIVARDGIAYFCAGLFTSEGGWLCAVRISSGRLVYKTALENTNPQGYMLASDSYLYVPTGRGRPAVHRRKDGEKVRDLGGAGGTFALLVGDSLIYGPGKTGQLGEFRRGVGDQIATFHGLHMIVAGDRSWLHKRDEISALDRKRFLRLVGEQRRFGRERSSLAKRLKRSTNAPTSKRLQSELEAVGAALDKIELALPSCVSWRTSCDLRYELIKTGDQLFLGGDGRVAAYSAGSGKLVWEGAVAGRAWGLTAAGGRLFVSTDTGVIQCFAPETGGSK